MERSDTTKQYAKRLLCRFPLLSSKTILQRLRFSGLEPHNQKNLLGFAGCVVLDVISNHCNGSYFLLRPFLSRASISCEPRRPSNDDRQADHFQFRTTDCG